MKAYNVEKFILVLRPFLGDAWKARRACIDTPGFLGYFLAFLRYPQNFQGKILIFSGDYTGDNGLTQQLSPAHHLSFHINHPASS